MTPQKPKKMTNNEIKKALYKEKPEASLLMISSGVAHYEASIDDGYVVYFNVPISDMGDTRFYPIMDAKLLNRWLSGE